MAFRKRIELTGLPKTGQTISYVAGDDGDYEAGYVPDGDRFVDNGDGTVTDNATGLMWVKDMHRIIPGGSGLAVPRGCWVNNTIYAVGDLVMNAASDNGTNCSYKDEWAEASTYAIDDVVYKDQAGVANCIDIFTAAVGTIRHYWIARAGSQGVDPATDDGSTWEPVSCYVCTQAHDSSVVSFGANGYWLLNLWIGATTTLGAESVHERPFIWHIADGFFTAVMMCNQLSHAGHTDWRLPNAMELLSIVDWPAGLPYDVFTNQASDGYGPTWCSTTALPTTNAWRFYMADDVAPRSYSLAKTSTLCYVRPCRGGRLNNG